MEVKSRSISLDFKTLPKNIYSFKKIKNDTHSPMLMKFLNLAPLLVLVWGEYFGYMPAKIAPVYISGPNWPWGIVI